MLELAREAQVNVGLGIQDGLRMVYVESALGEPMSGRQRVGLSVPKFISARWDWRVWAGCRPNSAIGW
ncbi:MAG: hypothetical protein R3D69_07135 [Xanthobacteraceae bacterium]